MEYDLLCNTTHLGDRNVEIIPNVSLFVLMSAQMKQNCSCSPEVYLCGYFQLRSVFESFCLHCQWTGRVCLLQEVHTNLVQSIIS